MTSKNQFTRRESAVIEFLSRGMSNKQIALGLGVSVRTVEFHLSKIYARLGVASRAEAIVRLAETHRRKSTVENGQYNTQDTAAPQPRRRIPMRVLAYMSAISLTIVFGVLLLAPKTPATSPNQGPNPQPTAPPSPSIPNSTPPLVTTSPPPNALSPAEFHRAPLSYSSVTGIAVEVSDLVYGPDCLRLQTLVSGLPSPNGSPLEDPFATISAISLIDPVTSRPLTLSQIGGGGGGGQATDGSTFIGREAVYRFTPELSPEGLVLLTVQIVANISLGFEGPLNFNMQAAPSDTENCGFQGTLGP